MYPKHDTVESVCPAHGAVESMRQGTDNPHPVRPTLELAGLYPEHMDSMSSGPSRMDVRLWFSVSQT